MTHRNDGVQMFSIHHVQLAIPPGGEDRARRFYRDILCLDEIPKPPELAKRGGLGLRGDALEIHFAG